MRSGFFEEAFDYQYQCDQELVKSFRAKGDLPSSKLRTLLSHIINAQHVWNHRIMGKPSRLGIWDEHRLDDIADLDHENREHSLWILEHKEGEDPIFYKNSKGEAYRNQVRDILFHVINHGTYHRGQIAMEMRQNGMDPIITDYAILRREKEG